MKKIICCFFIVVVASAYRVNEAGIDPRDAALFVAKASLVEAQANLASRTFAVAKSFAGAPYVPGTLDTGGAEKLVVNLRQLDCWTFVENSLAIALAAHDNPEDVGALEHYLRQLRYWGGNIDGYGSRIHYFTGWTLQAEKLGYITDITARLGGVPYKKEISYMSARPHKYPALNNPKNMQDIRAAEARINRHAWFFIPETNIEAIENSLKEGDIILLTSAKRDLDIAHQGFAVKRGNRMHLMHASSLAKRVVVSSQPIGEYVRSQVGQSGILVLRVN